MNPHHSAIYRQALGIQDPDERSEFLKQSCAGNVDLLAMFDALMAEETSGAVLPESDGAHRPSPERFWQGASDNTPIPEHIGPYRIVERIGMGGMGEVFRAEQRTPIRREAAIKLIKLGMDTKQVVARFEAERQAMALMDHPNIAKVYGADVDEKGRPYFAMEYVKGIPITDYADRNHLTVRERLELFQQVCHAIQHAHQKGVIHRDIKPSNVLVSTLDGAPCAKVIDFGIAKATAQPLTDKTMVTLIDQFIGTPQYMSPEQAAGGLDIDTRSDVYSLGVLLYELLTGQTPFDQSRLRRAALHEVARLLREEEPPKPSTRLGILRSTERTAVDPGKPDDASSVLDSIAKARSAEGPELIKEVRGELDWLVMKSLEKDRARRYDSPGALADDIGRFLGGSPIVAAPPTFRYRAGKFVSRYRLPVGLALGSAALLIASMVVVSSLAIRLNDQVKLSERSRIEAEKARNAEAVQRTDAERNRRIAEDAARKAEHASARNRALFLREQNLLDEALAAAKDAYRLQGAWEDSILIEEITDACRKTWDLQHRVSVGPAVRAAAFVDGPVERHLVLGSGKSLDRCNLATGVREKTGELKEPVSWIKPFRGAADRFVVGGANFIEVRGIDDLQVIVRKDLGDRKIVKVAAGVNRIAVTLLDDVTQVYDSELKLVGEQPWPANARRKGDNQVLQKLAISPSGRFVISSGVTHTNHCLVWDVESNTYALDVLPVNIIQFITETRLVGLAHGVNANGISLWQMILDPDKKDVSCGQRGDVAIEDLGNVDQIEWDRGVLVCMGRIGVATAVFGGNGYLDHCNITRYTSLFGIAGDDNPAPYAIAHPGFELAVGSKSGISVFSRDISGAFQSNSKGLNSTFGETALYSVDRLPESLVVSTVTLDDKQITTRRVLPSPAVEATGMNSIACGIAVSHDEKVLAVRFAEAERQLASGEKVCNHSVVVYRGWRGGQDTPLEAPVVIRLADQGGEALNAAHGSHQRLLELSRDGSRLLVGTRQETGCLAELYDTSTGALLKRWIHGDDFGDHLAVAPGTDWFADLSSDRHSIRLRDWKSGEILRSVRIGGTARSLCASPDGLSLMVGTEQGEIQRYGIETGERVGSLKSKIVPVACSPRDDVFLGIVADAGGGHRGSLVVADWRTGEVRTILQKGSNASILARFKRNGDGFGFSSRYGGVIFMRRMTPEMADSRLSRLHGSQIRYDRDRWFSSAPALALPEASIPSVEVRGFSAAYHAVTDSIEASDLESLRKQLNQKVKIKGRVVKVEVTRHKTGVNLFLNSVETGPMVWVKIHAVKNTSPGYFTSLLNKEITIQGNIGTYKGFSRLLKDRLQIDLASMDDVALIPGAGNPEPGSPGK